VSDEPSRYAAFSDCEVQALIDGLDAWDGETAAISMHRREPYVALMDELEAELKRRGLDRR
jgi:hypothetical protein